MRKSVSKQYTKNHFIYLSKLYIVHCPWTIGSPLWPELQFVFLFIDNLYKTI